MLHCCIERKNRHKYNSHVVCSHCRFMTWLFKRGSFQFEGNLLLTSPNENKRQVHVIAIANHSGRHMNNSHSASLQPLLSPSQHQQSSYGALGSSPSETLGTVNSDDPRVTSPPQSQKQSSQRRRNPTGHSTTTHSVHTDALLETLPT